MGKLIELLNEWLQTSDLWEFYDKIYYEEFCGGEVIKIMAKIRQKYKATGDGDADMTHLICLKKYEFIKRLVDNDKIDVESYCRITSVERKGEKDVYRDEVDSLLMLLAIQDEPIEFLCSILK